jgi:general secretion pathway protein G
VKPAISQNVGSGNSARNRQRRYRFGVTLIELLVVIAIIAILAGLLLPVLAMVRQKSALTTARQMVQQVAQALESYRLADGEHRYPTPQSDRGLSRLPPAVGSSAVLALLAGYGLPELKVEESSVVGRLEDPWGSPFMYDLVRPVVSDPAALESWNWDPATGHERAWDRRWDESSKAIVLGALPYPYVYSFGPTARTDVGADWIFVEDQR